MTNKSRKNSHAGLLANAGAPFLPQCPSGTGLRLAACTKSRHSICYCQHQTMSSSHAMHDMQNTCAHLHALQMMCDVPGCKSGCSCEFAKQTCALFGCPHQVINIFACTDGMVKAALVAVLQDEPRLQQIRALSCLLHLVSWAVIRPVPHVCSSKTVKHMTPCL